MTFRLLIAAAVAAAVAAPALARDLTVASRVGASRGGADRDAQREAYFRPFTEATGLPLREEVWEGGLGVLRGKAGSGAGAWDVVQVKGGELLSGCEEGLLEKLDWGRIGGKDHYLPQGVSECGVGTLLRGFVLSWDRDKFPGTPGWADFWDVAKYPGKRGLWRGVRMNLEIALLADGVAPGDVYRTLRTDEGVDRAFRKLDQLRPYLVWWDAGTPAPRLLGSGEVLMTSAPSARVVAANHGEQRNFGIQWAGSLNTVDSWAIVKGSPNLDPAYRFLAFAGDPKAEAKLTSLIPYGGLARGAGEGLPADIQALSPASPDNLKGALSIDETFWRDNLDRLSRRFDDWLAR